MSIPLSDSPRRGAPTAMLLGAACAWGAAGLLVRGSPMAGPQLAFWRSLAGAAIYQLVLGARGEPPRLKNLKAAAIGGLGFGLSIVFQFIAYKATTLVSANVIASLQPLLLAAWAHHVAKDRQQRSAVAATVLAVAGTILVVVASTSSGAWSVHGDLAATAGMVASCLYPIGIKRARPNLGVLEFQASALWISALVTLPFALASGPGMTLPSLRQWTWIIGLVAVGGTGHLLFTKAQHHVSVVASSTITLAEVIAVAVGAAILFRQPVTVLEVVGIVIVAAGVGWWVART